MLLKCSATLILGKFLSTNVTLDPAQAYYDIDD